MTRDPIAILTARITDLNLQILQLTRRIEALEEKGDDEEASQDELTCQRLCIVDEEGTERIKLEVDEDDNATVEFCDPDGTRRIFCGAFTDGEAYTHWADAQGDPVLIVRCTADGAGTFEEPKDE